MTVHIPEEYRSYSLEVIVIPIMDGEFSFPPAQKGNPIHAESRNRPLRVGATHREATKPSEASAERGRERRGVGRVVV